MTAFRRHRQQLDRRRLLVGAAGLALAGRLPAARAAAQGGDAKVFLNYTQKELDAAYNQGPWAPNAGEVIKRYTTRSAATRQTLEHQAGIAYGASPDETLDVFPAKPARAPIQIFIHGGAWNSGGKDDYSFPAETFVPAGAAYVALNFANIPTVRLPEMADQVGRAIIWVYRNAASFGGDPDKIFISGHSSGGHLAGLMLTTDWAARGVPADIVKGGTCMSGMFEMGPVMLSSRSTYVKLSEDEVAALSAMRHLDRVRAPIVVAHGDKESPEFQRQSAEFAAALKGKGLRSEFLLLQGLNHFEVADSLADPHSPLSQAVLRQMALSPA